MLTPAFFEHAHALAPVFQELAATVPYEKKGILFSEMLFLAALVKSQPENPLRIIESGRARAQSTFILARLFPELPVVSIEYDADSADTAVAAERLKDCGNVELLFGDSTAILPQMVRSGDVVLIDGPKHFRALRLAMRLLNANAPQMVLIHDVHRGIPERAFLVRCAPQAAFSDDEAFVRKYRHLDDSCWVVEQSSTGGDNPHGFGNALEWIIAGGESGPGARPMHPAWIRGLRDQATAAGVPFFFKQWGPRDAGRQLDGRTWEEVPHA
jgi:hypothetical protein